jgi:iron complex transport system substrate-binding protein
VRIVSLLPSATEIVFALGLGDQLRGRSFECDWPAAAAGVPVVSDTALAASGDPGAIDAEVSALVGAGEPIYTLDAGAIRSIAPDLILAQDLCRVCAVPSGAVNDALATMGCSAEVLSLDPHSLDEVLASITAVGEATGTTAKARQLVAEARSRLHAVAEAVAGRPRRGVLVLEWADPAFGAGHWVPDQVRAAGGVPVPDSDPGPSRRLSWPEVADAVAACGDDGVVVFAPCGFDLAGAVDQAGALMGRDELSGAGEVWAVDANALVSRPGPRVVDGVETLAAILHPGALPQAPTGASRLR